MLYILRIRLITETAEQIAAARCYSCAMNYTIRNNQALKKILWVDFLCGITNGLAGLLFVDFFAPFLGLPEVHLLVICAVTVLYACGALYLATQKTINIPFLLVQIYANWFWTAVSVGLLAYYYAAATVPGIIFLVLQIVVVGGLAWLENNQLVKKTDS